eukprot:gene5966-6910_t
MYLAIDTLYFNSWDVDFNTADYLVLGLFLASGITTFTASTLWHALGCHSLPLWKNLLLCDYMGIIFQIGASFFPPLYYAYHCNPFWMVTYMSAITILCSGLCTLVFVPSLAGHHRLRTGFFAATGFFGIVPTLHVFSLLPSEFATPFCQRVLIMFLLFGLGLVFYVTKFPECYFPGLMDKHITSHAIWHLFTFIAPLYHFNTCYHTFILQNRTCDMLWSPTAHAPIAYTQ